MTKRDTLTSPVPPDERRPMMGDPLDPIRQICNEIDASVAAELAKLERPRHVGIEAAERYLDSHAADKPPFPWPFVLAVLAIVAVLVAVCAISWDAIAAGVAFLGLAPAAGAQFVAEAGRAMGQDVVK